MFLHCITTEQAYKIDSTRRKIYTLKTGSDTIINSEELFWRAVIEVFPLNPSIEMSSRRKPIGALGDSLFGGLLGKKDTTVDVVWPFADSIAHPFLIDKVHFWHDVAFSIQPDEERGVVLRLFLVCANEPNRKRLESMLYPLFNLNH